MKIKLTIKNIVINIRKKFLMRHNVIIASSAVLAAVILISIFAVHNAFNRASDNLSIAASSSKTITLKNESEKTVVPAVKIESQPSSKKAVSSSAAKVGPAAVSSKPNPQTVSSQDQSQKTAYLTFDDGPSELTPQLLNILRENNVKATFFVITRGEDTPQKRAWMKMEVDQGNTIGIHSWSHDYNTIYSSEQNFLNDFQKIRNMVVAATGVDPKIMRFPGGIGNTVSIRAAHGKAIMPVLVNKVESMGITPFDWNAGGQDAVSRIPSADTLVRYVLDDCQGHKNVIILLHDSVPHNSSIAAVPAIIKKP